MVSTYRKSHPLHFSGRKAQDQQNYGQPSYHLDEISEIFEKGSAGPFDGFLSKAKKPFSAFLRFDSDNRVKFDFERDAPSARGSLRNNLKRILVAERR